MTFIERLETAWTTNRSLVCVGLDPEPTRFPARLKQSPDRVFVFCRSIVDATADLACCFKPQIAHFAAQGAEDALARLIKHVHERHPTIPVILDAKRGDIGSTAQHYATEVFDRYGADAARLFGRRAPAFSPPRAHAMNSIAVGRPVGRRARRCGSAGAVR